MCDHEFALSLSVRHPDIDPSRITRALGMQPGHVWRKGEQRLDSAGDVLGGSHRASYWLCEIAPRHAFSGERISVEGELSRVLDVLRQSADFMQEMRRGGGESELFVTIFTRGDLRVELLPEAAALLGRMGVAITIEIKPYVPPATEAIASQ